MGKMAKFFVTLAACVVAVTAGMLLSADIHPLRQCFYALYCLTPALAVLITDKEGVGAMLRRYRADISHIDPKRSLMYILGMAFLLPLSYILCVWIAGNLAGVEQLGRIAVPDAGKSSVVLYFSGVGLSLIAGVTVNMLLGLGGEMGWRGFLGQHLKMSPCRRSVATGLIWGTWYMPLSLVGRLEAGTSVGIVIGAAVVAYLVCIVLSFLLDGVYRLSGSLLVPAAVWGVFTSSVFMLDFQSGGEAPFTGTYGVAGVVSLALLWLVFRWTWPAESQ